MSIQTFKPTRIPAALALVALVLSAVSMLGFTESPADAYTGKPKARADKASVLVGKKVVVVVLANDRIGTKKVKVRLKAVPTTLAVSVNRKQRVVIKTTAATKPGRYTAKYQVIDAKKRKAKASIVITVAAREVVTNPTPTPTPTPTVTPTATPTSTPTVTPTSTPTSTPTAAPDSLTAVINSLPVAAEMRTGYDRDTWKHWNSGLYADGCDTRAEVLRTEAVVAPAAGTACPYTTARSGGGQWFSYYDGVSTTDPSSFDIDHMVPLAEAHDSGGHAWTAAQKEVYANDQGDPRSLVAVTASSNRGKSDQDPGEWWPLLERCRYAAEWTATKARFSLTVDQVEKDALLLQASQCGETTVTYTKAW